MKSTSLLAIVVAAVVLQMALARYAIGGRWAFDLVLVGVIYAALYGGPVSGMLAGTFGGLMQDVLSDDIVGVGGLVKTLIGFAAGAIGAHFVVTRPWSKVLFVAPATLVHRLLILAIYGLIDQHWPGVRWGTMLIEIMLNSAAAFVAFQFTEALPGAVARRRQSRRPKWASRNW